MSLLDWEKRKHANVSLMLTAAYVGRQNLVREAAIRLAHAAKKSSNPSVTTLDEYYELNDALDKAMANPFRVWVNPMQASNGLTYFVMLERTDMPKDTPEQRRVRNYISVINRHDVDEANSEGYTWAAFLGVPFVPCEKVEDTASIQTVPLYGTLQSAQWTKTFLDKILEYGDRNWGEGFNCARFQKQAKETSDETMIEIKQLITELLLRSDLAPPENTPVAEPRKLTGVVFRFE